MFLIVYLYCASEGWGCAVAFDPGDDLCIFP